jgi:hypothetical protein
VLTRLATAVAPHGLNVIGATPIAAYDAGLPAGRRLGTLLPAARTAIVIGNGGGAFWEVFRVHCRRRADLARHPDPVDAFTREVVERAVATAVPPPVRILYPFRFPDDPVSFMRLAECAGLGRRSLLGVLVHPLYGPWMALRAALLVPDVVHAPRPADGFDPCPACRERPCMAACPAGAVADGGWDVPRCAAHRAATPDPCATRCHARSACVLAPEHRYPDEALAYHQSRAGALLGGTAARRA